MASDRETIVLVSLFVVGYIYIAYRVIKKEIEKADVIVPTKWHYLKELMVKIWLKRH